MSICTSLGIPSFSFLQVYNVAGNPGTRVSQTGGRKPSYRPSFSAGTRPKQEIFLYPAIGDWTHRMRRSVTYAVILYLLND